MFKLLSISKLHQGVLTFDEANGLPATKSTFYDLNDSVLSVIEMFLKMEYLWKRDKLNFGFFFTFYCNIFNANYIIIYVLMGQNKIQFKYRTPK